VKYLARLLVRLRLVQPVKVIDAVDALRWVDDGFIGRITQSHREVRLMGHQVKL
jgi:hypothetical protein